ncbi:helix-turn-helix domain-containing protein [Conexibacter sp. W3-3-2]|uniref:helix-turn-helix domain-containing protein n=1 Tax=Conexibacter sp. W3-3-2 TaxID=2675227 RepID=UPI0012B9F0D3|nr:helix-turn-helix domain-containing protein [Conexibacter sp. W3-3-2]
MTLSDNTPRHLRSPQDALLDAEAVARLLQVPVSWVYAEARAGRLPHVCIGRYRRFRRGTLEEWIASHETGSRR